MKSRLFTYLACDCGHRGAIIESMDDQVQPDGWYQAWLRDLTHRGTYEGLDEIFDELKPGCPDCGRSLGPEHIVGRNELTGPGSVLRRLGAHESTETVTGR